MVLFPERSANSGNSARDKSPSGRQTRDGKSAPLACFRMRHRLRGLVSTGLGVAGIAATVAGATPVVGQVISGLSILADVYGAGKEIANCN